MSEEIRREAAIGDADLESVSGGRIMDAASYESLARLLCYSCKLKKHWCTGSQAELAAYLAENDIREMDWVQCPFRRVSSGR